MTPAELSRTVLTTVRRAVAAEELRVEVPERIVVQRPPRPGCGDYATNVAFQLAGAAGRTAREVAEILGRRLAKEPGIAQVEVAGPGFLNITLDAQAYGDVVRQVRAQGAEYGCGDGMADEPVTMEADPEEVRASLVAQVVNGLARAAGAPPAAPGKPELLTAAEPAAPAEPAAAGPAVTEPATPDEPAASAEPPSARSAFAESAASAEPSPAEPVPGTPVPGTPVPEAPVPAMPAPPAPQPQTLGPDELRWALLRPPLEDTPRLTPALLAQRESNPLFRIRYAHARTRAVLRNAHDLGVDIETAADDPYHHPAETELLGLIADFPRVIETAARRRAPDRLARHMERLADSFLRFHDECPLLPKGEEKPSAVHAARVRLADAAGIVLADGLHFLGISAPDHL